MSINEFVEMTIFLRLICFSIYDKMQGFIDESGLFIFFGVLRRNLRWPPKVARKRFLQKVASRLQIPCGSKISSKLLYLAPFPR